MDHQVFHEYIDVFMKIFLHDFTIFSDLSKHFQKVKKKFYNVKNMALIWI
jgi:hypothetical protein